MLIRLLWRGRLNDKQRMARSSRHFLSVTHPFTFLATKKDKLSRQMDDAENEQDMNRVSIFVAESLTLKPTRPMG